MEKSISVRVMGREYTLRVNAQDEAMTKEIAAYVDDKMTAFRTAFPKQPEITTAVIAALSIAEELHTARDQQDKIIADTDDELLALTDKLSFVLDAETEEKADNSEAAEKAPPKATKPKATQPKATKAKAQPRKKKS